MLAALRRGDAKTLAELMRQDPGFNVNLVLDEYGWTLLHEACNGDSRSAVIPLLLAHPDIDVNLKDSYGRTPFDLACSGRTSCVREMLKDSKVKPNEPKNDGLTPLYRAAYCGHLDVIKWWVASGREMDLGTPEDVNQTDSIGWAKKRGQTEVVTLLERFKSDASKTRHAMRLELRWYDGAAEIFALVVFVSDGLLKITTTPAARFFKIAEQLPLELQMVLSFRLVGSAREIISGKDSEMAFRLLAKRI